MDDSKLLYNFSFVIGFRKGFYSIPHVIEGQTDSYTYGKWVGRNLRKIITNVEKTLETQ